MRSINGANNNRKYVEIWRADIHMALVHLWKSMLDAAQQIVKREREMRRFFGLENGDVEALLVAGEPDLMRIAGGMPYPFRPARPLTGLLRDGRPTEEERRLAGSCRSRGTIEMQILWTSYLTVLRSVLERDERARVLCGLALSESSAVIGASIASIQTIAAAGPYCFVASESLRGALRIGSAPALTRRELIRRTAADIGVIARVSKGDAR
jgi:hypothetical protein